MKMIPTVPSSETRSRAELRIFESLQLVEIGPARGFHSLNLPKHDYKLVGELDFVIVTPRDLLVLEVKGGRVSSHEGIWLFTDRFGTSHRTSEGPFQQARSGMYSLMRRIEEQIPWSRLRRLSTGFGVVTPDCTLDVASAEWVPEMVLDERDFNSKNGFRKGIARVLDFWRARHGRRETEDEALYSEICTFLRPDFDRVLSLRARGDEIDRHLEALTADQYSVLDVIEDNPRILCVGGAGTGKTFLAAETTRRQARLGQKTLLVCRSETLASFLRSRVLESNATVTHMGAALLNEQYDALVVDEAQDVMNLDDLTSLDSVLVGGLSSGKWRIFFDPNNQSTLVGRFEVEAVDLLRSTGAVWAALQRNCRNTKQIVLQTRLLTGADLGQPMAGEGLPVEFAFYKDPLDAAGLLSRRLDALVEEGASLSDITILSPSELGDSSVRLLSNNWKTKLLVVDEQNAGSWPVDRLTFLTVERMKGLENRIVLLTDVTSLRATSRDVAALYVAMSRARAGLWIAMDSRLEDELRQVSEANLHFVIGDAANE